jgi:hypothetical protein
MSQPLAACLGETAVMRLARLVRRIVHGTRMGVDAFADERGRREIADVARVFWKPGNGSGV